MVQNNPQSTNLITPIAKRVLHFGNLPFGVSEVVVSHCQGDIIQGGQVARLKPNSCPWHQSEACILWVITVAANDRSSVTKAMRTRRMSQLAHIDDISTAFARQASVMDHAVEEVRSLSQEVRTGPNPAALPPAHSARTSAAIASNM